MRKRERESERGGEGEKEGGRERGREIYIRSIRSRCVLCLVVVFVVIALVSNRSVWETQQHNSRCFSLIKLLFGDLE